MRGLLDPLKEEERLASLISDRIAPRLIPTIDVIAWRSAQLIVVEVFPSSNRPHYLKNLGPEEGVFVRIGSTNRKADAALRQELRRMASNETFDESPLAEFDSEALDFRAASESFPARGQLKKADLQTLQLLTSHGRRLERPAHPCIFLHHVLRQLQVLGSFGEKGSLILRRESPKLRRVSHHGRVQGKRGASTPERSEGRRAVAFFLSPPCGRGAVAIVHW